MPGRTIAFPVASLLLILVAAVATASSPLIFNGDFETGDAEGWSIFTDDNGVVGPVEAVVFDVLGTGSPNYALRFNAGQNLFISECEGQPFNGSDPATIACRNNPASGLFLGGGVSQEVALDAAGMFTVSADVASSIEPFNDNQSAGMFELIVNGSVVAVLDLGPIGGGFGTADVLRGSLSAHLTLAPGTHEIAVRLSRPWQTEESTPRQFVDNISLRPVSKVAVLAQHGVDGAGLASAPGMQKPFNPRSSAAESVGVERSRGTSVNTGTAELHGGVRR